MSHGFEKKKITCKQKELKSGLLAYGYRADVTCGIHGVTT